MKSDWKNERHVVLDACALIAFLNDEPGAEMVGHYTLGAPVATSDHHEFDSLESDGTARFIWIR